MAGEPHGASDCHSAFHPHHDRSRIFSLDALLHLVSLAIELAGFAEQETRHVQKVDPHVQENELLQLFQAWFIVEDRIARDQEDVRPEGGPDLARGDRLFEFPNLLLPAPILVNIEGDPILYSRELALAEADSGI